MDKKTLIGKLESTVGTLKEQLDKNDGSALSAMAEGARTGFDSLRGSIMGNEKARNALDSAKTQLGKLEDAIRAGDKKVSAKAVAMMENALRDLKERVGDKAEDTAKEEQNKES